MVTLLDMHACIFMTVRSYICLEYQENFSAIEVYIESNIIWVVTTWLHVTAWWLLLISSYSYHLTKGKKKKSIII